MVSAASHFRESVHGDGQRGFSLLELLVVLAIIALLASVIISSVAAARERARTTVCASNLRQWSIACINYCQQHDDYLPRRGMGVQPTSLLSRPEDWFNALPTVMAMGQPLGYALVRRPPQGAGQVSVALSHGDRSRARADLLLRHEHATEHVEQYATGKAHQHHQSRHAGFPFREQFHLRVNLAIHAGVLARRPTPGPDQHRLLDGHVDNFHGAYVGCGVGDPLRNDVCWIVPGDPWQGPQSN